MVFVTNDDILGRNMKYLRKKENLSLIEMARIINMEVNKLEQLELGMHYEIDYLCVCSVVEHFHCDMERLFDIEFEKMIT